MKRVMLVLMIGLMLCAIAGSVNNTISVNAQEQIKGINAKNYIVVDSNGYVLVENNADEKREVASICKLMTTLITIESIEEGKITLDDKFVASDYACMAEGSQAFLDAGCEYRVNDLLKSVIVASANDSAIVLAENLAGSEENFVMLMNSRAKELGMNNTIYSNSTGLTNGREQYSTARDTAKILNEVSKYKLYQNDCKIWMDKLIHPSGRETELVNTNRLIKYYENCLTGKTGFTDEAGYCLSSTAMKNNMKLTCVVLGCDGSSNRFTDSISLYNYAYANFENKKLLDKNILLDNDISIVRGKQDDINVHASEDFYLTQKKNSDSHVEIQYNLSNKLTAPIKAGDVIGTAKVILNNKCVAEVEILSAEDISEQSLSDIIIKIVDRFGFVS